MRAILTILLVAINAAVLADACGDFRSKRLVYMAMEEAWQTAMVKSDGKNTNATAALEDARQALYTSEGAVRLVIANHDDGWSDVIETLVDGYLEIRRLRARVASISVENQDSRFDFWRGLYAIESAIEDEIRSAILLACDEAIHGALQ